MNPEDRPPTTQELELMKVVWRLGSATVREVYEIVREGRQVAYTTVMTTMSILESKGYLRRERQGRAYVYTPTRPRQQVETGMVREFLDRVFNGSARPLVLHLVRDRKLEPEELEEIARLIEEEDDDV